LQLQNSSALGVEVYIFVSMHAMLKKKIGCLTLEMIY